MRKNYLLLDVETQREFLDRSGKLYAPPARDVARNLRKLFKWARNEEIPVVSTALRVRKGEVGPLAGTPHCIEGTLGEQKSPATLLPRRVDFGLRNTTDLPEDVFEDVQQVIIEKRDTDIFSHARCERLITEMAPEKVFICGVGLAQGIYQAAIGLRSRDIEVVLAEDAVLDLNDDFAEMAELRMRAKGVQFEPTEEIAVKLPRHRRYRAAMPA